MTDDTVITPAGIEEMQRHSLPLEGYGAGGRLAEALAKAQGEIRNPGKDKTAQIRSDKGSYSYSYATLADGIAVIREPLSKHGIAWVQWTSIEGDILILTTSLVHAVSGETLEARWPIGNYTRLTPQQMGSSLTYAKRYTLFSLVGIAGADEDDDGAAATAASRAIIDNPTIDLDQQVFIERRLTETKSNVPAFLTILGASSLANLTVTQYQQGLTLIEDNEKKKAKAKEKAEAVAHTDAWESGRE